MEFECVREKGFEVFEIRNVWEICSLRLKRELRNVEMRMRAENNKNILKA